MKCVDRETGEEIYFNTTLPKGVGSWATEEEALKAIGAKIADEFSREFFLQHVSATRQESHGERGRTAGVSARSRSPANWSDCPMSSRWRPARPRAPSSFELQLAGSGAAADLVAAGVLKPLNAKLGQPCFSLGSVAADQVAVLFDKPVPTRPCSRASRPIHRRVFTARRRARQKTVVKNPETLPQAHDLSQGAARRESFARASVIRD